MFSKITNHLLLGATTTIYITPSAREIDENGQLLTETQRNCRLSEDTDELKIFNIYTQEGCLLECKLGMCSIFTKTL